jgi:elongation factor P hydroxylase
VTLYANDDECCRFLIHLFSAIFEDVIIKGGADEPLYTAAREGTKARLDFRENYPRSLLHEIAHYCLAGERRRKIDDFGYWYSPCGRSREEQLRFEIAEARPQGLEKAMCEVVGIEFSPSLDDFSGNSPSQNFLRELDAAYDEMKTSPPPTAKKVLSGLKAAMISL